MKVQEIARKLGVSRQFVNMLQRGAKELSSEKMETLDNLSASITIRADGATNNGNVQAIGTGITVQDPSRLDRIEAKLDALATDVAILKKMMAK